MKPGANMAAKAEKITAEIRALRDVEGALSHIGESGT